MNKSPVILTNPEKFSRWEEIYLSLRRKEGRIYPDEVLKTLPIVQKNHPLKSEWKVREHSGIKLVKYLSSKQTHRRILEIGCGNGWLSHTLSKIDGSKVTGADINMRELEQATRIFGYRQNLEFIYADIFETSFKPEKFDVIIIASVIQYFPEPDKLIDRLLEFLSNKGEIHIIDSPLYRSENEAFEATKRSVKYFQNQGSPEMSKYYFHHINLFLNKYSFHIIKPALVDKIFGRCPFSWIIINKR